MVSFKTIALLAAAQAVSVVAQTPSDFTPATTNTLYVKFANNTVSPPGELIPRNDTLLPPNITTNSVTGTQRLVVMMIDLDVLRNTTRVPLLHWLAANATKQFPNQQNSTLNITNPPSNGLNGAPYLQPTPPAGDIPHRYVQLIFNQPANFSFASYGNLSANRVNFTYQSFIRSAGLGAPLAANYIRVQTANATTGAASSTTSGAAGAGATSSTRTTAAVATATRNAADVLQAVGAYGVAGVAAVAMLL